MDVQSNPKPCSIENCSKFSRVMSSLRNVNTAGDDRPKYSRRKLFGLKAKYHVPKHLYHLLKREGIHKTRRNRAGVSVNTNLRIIPVLERSTKIMNGDANLRSVANV